MKRIVVLIAVLVFLITVPVMGQTSTTVDPPVAIPDNTGAATACQSIVVAGGPGSISDVNVQLELAHSWAGDLTAVLTRDPGGANNALTLMNRPGRNGTGAGNNADFVTTSPIIIMDAPATDSAEDIGTAGTVICQDDGICDYLSAPDTTDTPIAGVGTDLSDFNGLDANVTWELCMGDSAGGDTGTLSAWSIGFSTLPVELQTFEIE